MSAKSEKIFKIVEELYKNGDFDRLMAKHVLTFDQEADRQIRMDFKHDLAIILMEYKDIDKLLELYEKGKIGQLVRRIILNNIKSQTSPYFKKYGRWQNGRKTFEDWDNSPITRMQDE